MHLTLKKETTRPPGENGLQQQARFDLKWLDPDQTVDEAQNVYPGKLVIGLCYLPIGSCLAGSGDPYFLNLDANSEDPALVRIPHDFIADDAYPEEEIELVCHSLSIFFEQSEIE